jgi:hypothetical protein
VLLVRRYSTKARPTIAITIRVPLHLWREVQLQLADPRTGHIRYGLWTHTFERLIQRWLDEQRPTPPTAEQQ